MDPRFQTSFIPKKPLISNSQAPTKTINLFALIASLVFISTLALTGWVYFYNNLLLKQIDESKKTLELAKGAFEPETINKIIHLDKRIGVARGLLNGHIAASYIFDVISASTLRTIRFKNFSYQYLTSDKIQLAMRGQAQSFTSVALQSDTLNSVKYLKDTVISDLSLDVTGTVSFLVTTTIIPSTINLKDILKSKSVVDSTNTNE